MPKREGAAKMPLPASFDRDGFHPAAKARERILLPNGHRLKPLLIGTEGKTNTGKTEFILSCPGPGLVIALDRGLGLLDNPNPPSSRNPDFAWKVIKVPANTSATQPTYMEYFNDARDSFYRALDNPDSITVALDGDSDFWELHRLMAFGKLANVWPQTKYGDVYAQRRAITNRAWDKAKIVIATNKVTAEYVPIYKADGTPEVERDGSEKRKKSGNFVRQGFPDQDFLWEVQLLHLCKPAHINPITNKQVPMQWGIRILKCKHNPEMIGEELWGESCNFQGLVSLIYPDVPMAEWNL
jgi:hypothetical protein